MCMGEEICKVRRLVCMEVICDNTLRLSLYTLVVESMTVACTTDDAPK